jgi:hypothetical protein
MKDRLFVPLNKHWYDLFLEGKKKWEIRGLSNRFNRQTVRVGRDVELRRGYAKEGAVWGKIVEVHIVSTVYIPIINVLEELFPIPKSSPLWDEIQEYNAKYSKFIVFKIEVNKNMTIKETKIMICGHCPLLLIRGDRYYCENLEEEVNPNDDCLEDEEARP